MVSKASDDLPDPDRPVKTMRRSRGSSMLTFLRLCSRAPRTISVSDMGFERLTGLAQLALQVADLVAQAGGVLEAQLGGRLVHLLLQGLDEPAELVVGHLQQLLPAGRLPGGLAAPPLGRHRRLVGTAPDHLEDVGHLLADRLRVDAVL